MNILFVHQNYPAQFRHLAEYFSACADNTVVFVSEEKRDGISIPGLRHIPVSSPRLLPPEGGKRRSFVLERHVECSERFSAVFLELRRRGFCPDLVYAHPGWGGSLFLRDVFPESTFACFCEWYYTKDADYTFFSAGRPKSPVEFAALRL